MTDPDMFWSDVYLSVRVGHLRRADGAWELTDAGRRVAFARAREQGIVAPDELALLTLAVHGVVQEEPE